MRGEANERQPGRARTNAGAGRYFRYLALAASWLALWRISALMEYAPHASIWFPPAGLSFAALLLMGWRALPVLAACAVLVTFWVDRMYALHAPLQELLLAGVLFGSTHCLAYGTGAFVLKRSLRRSGMQSVPSLIILFLSIGCLASLGAALAGVHALELAGLLHAADAASAWLPWWIGDMAGVLVLAPLCLGLLSWRYPQIEPWLGGLDFAPQAHRRRTYLLKLALLLGLLALVLLASARIHADEAGYAIFFLILPQMWIVYTETPFRSAISLALFSTLTALGVSQLGLVEQALLDQFAVCVIAASAYFGFAVPTLAAHNRVLSELAFHDPLTQTATKAHFFEVARIAVEDARRTHQPVSLVVLDIDRFKQVNDEFGHVAGDHALATLAHTVRTQLDANDLIGRFGGDEFTLLLPGRTAEQAEDFAGRLKHLLRNTPVHGIGQGLSASFGVAGIAPSETLAQAFQRADRQLLESKRSGRHLLGRA